MTRLLPDANPDYRLDQVRAWLIEFDEEGLPGREIGLDGKGAAVLAGPDERNYGFWLDTNMKWDDFEGEPVTAEAFESAWRRWPGFPPR